MTTMRQRRAAFNHNAKRAKSMRRLTLWRRSWRKMQLNGTYGKFGLTDYAARMYNPQLMQYVTAAAQRETLEAIGRSDFGTPDYMDVTTLGDNVTQRIITGIK